MNLSNPSGSLSFKEIPMSSEAPTAPPIDHLQLVSGYGHASFTPVVSPPPKVNTPSKDGQVQRQLPALDDICEEDVKNALDEFAAENSRCCCRPKSELQVKEIVMKSAFHYQLETFTEKRETSWVYEPYKGDPICAGFGPPPGPWQVYVTPDALFQDSQKSVEIPNSAFVKPCHVCTGNTRIRCKTCTGYGGSTCLWCQGSGRVQNNQQSENCSHCVGAGRMRCLHCQGHGQVRCHECLGFGQIKCNLQLKVSWQNHQDDHVSGQSVIPEELTKQVTGHVVLDERQARVYPIVNFPNDEVSQKSIELIQKHVNLYPMERIIEQRQSIKIVPEALVTYKHGSRKGGSFYVYGLEHRVYFPDYPRECCGCSIL